MLVCCWSPKGGSGTSVVAAAAAIVLARRGGVVLADLAGDQPAVLGLGNEPRTGLRDWIAAGVGAPADALTRLAVDVAPGFALLGAGTTGGAELGSAAPEVGAALAVALRDSAVPTIVDAGVASSPAHEALLEVADATILVIRGCYLALRRAARHPATARCSGVVFVQEPGRSLGARDIGDVLHAPLLATVDVRPRIASAVDAGVLLARPPDSLVSPVRDALDLVGLGREGRAA